MGIFDRKTPKNTVKDKEPKKDKSKKKTNSTVTAIYDRNGVPTFSRGINPDNIDKFVAGAGRITNLKIVTDDE